MNNEMHLQFPAKSINESFARLVIIGFIAPLDPNAQELNEIKTIVSEGVTNAIIHGYEDDENGIIDMKASLEGRRLRLTTFFPQRTPTVPQLAVIVFALFLSPAVTAIHSVPILEKGLKISN